jgi:ABC-type phosphate transport system substrate-binding protein
MKQRTQNIFMVAVLLVVILAISTTATVQAQVSIIVAKSSAQKVSKEEAKDIFMGATSAWGNGAKIQVIDQSDTEVGKTFYESFVGKSANQVRLQWTKLVLSGQAQAPKKLNDDEAVRKAVADDPNAIGYIQSSAMDGSVKEIARIQ